MWRQRISRKRTPASSCCAIVRSWHFAVPGARAGSKRAPESWVPGIEYCEIGSVPFREDIQLFPAAGACKNEASNKTVMTMKRLAMCRISKFG